MKCDEFREIVFELASGELDSHRAEAAEKHMADCPQCREEYDRTFALTASLRALAEEEAPKELLPNVMKRISAEKRHRRMNSVIRFGTAAAAAVVLVVGAVNVLPGLEKKEPKNETTENNNGSEQNFAEDVTVDDANPLVRYIVEDNEFTADDESVVMNAQQSAAERESGAAAAESSSAAQPIKDMNKKEVENEKPEKASQVQSSEPQQTDGSAAAVTGSSGDEIAAPRTALLDAPEKMSLEDESDTDEAAYSMDADEASDAGKVGKAGKASGSSGGGSSGGGIMPLQDTEDLLIITAGIDNGTVIETEERSFISRKCEFIVSAEYGAAAGTVAAQGKSMARVSAELSALGVEYEVYITEDDYTAEYRTADAARRAAIEAMCAVDNCVINIR